MSIDYKQREEAIKRLKEEITKNGLRATARATDISASFLSRILSGERSPSIKTVNRLITKFQMV